MFYFDIQRFGNFNTAENGTVLSSAQITAGKDSLNNSITDYVKTIAGSNTTITVTKGSGDTYAVTLSGGNDSFNLANGTGTLSVAKGGTGQTLLANVLGVGSATKATQDANGNIITSSYLRKNTDDTLTGNLVVTGTSSVGSNLSVAGGIRSAGAVTVVSTASIGGSATITGSLRLKGSGNYGNKLNFGDGDYVYLYEPADDQLEIKAKQISLTSSSANQVWVNGTNITALGGGNNVDVSTATVAAADKLTTSRSLKVSLGNSNTATFNGSADATLIGVGGVLGTANGGLGSSVMSTARSNLGLGAIAVQGTPLAVTVGGTGQTVLSAVTVGKANSLTTAQSLKVSLSSSSAQTFNGSSAATLIGVGGVLPVSNGGTGVTALTSVTVGKANTLTTAQNIVASLGSSVAGSFDGSAAVTVGTQGTLPINKGGTGTTTATPMFYGTCSTAASTAAKVVTCSGFVLTTGAQITVKFTTTSTAASPTLNVNSTGAKTIQYQGYPIVSGALRANGFYHFLYDGSYWQVVGPLVWTE